jgi:hypothetical protein
MKNGHYELVTINVEKHDILGMTTHYFLSFDRPQTTFQGTQAYRSEAYCHSLVIQLPQIIPIKL